MFTVLVGAACSRPTSAPGPIRTLPIRLARPISLGVESRPSRLVMAGERLVWTVPSSSEATIEVGLGELAGGPGTPETIVRAFRSGSEALGRVSVRPGDGWKTWKIAWSAHARPAKLEIDVERSGDALPGKVPAAALIAEPLLVPRNLDRSPPNVVVFLVDTLRADHLGCYGDPTARTPRFDLLAREGVLVERALSTANWTLPAHASLFTSTGVSVHGTGGSHSSLPESLPTLAGVLQRRGYRALAMTNAGFLDPRFGLARGFERYLSVPVDVEPVEESLKRAVALLKEAGPGPFFLFFHTYQVHQYSRRPGDPVHRDESARAKAVRLKRQYDEEVARTDSAFGVFRSQLDQLGLASRTAIVLTSDHGEILDDGLAGESMQWGHGSPYLHDNENRIPLILFDPRNPGKGSRLSAPVSITDVAPTVLAVLGLDAEPAFRGMDFSRNAASIPAARLRVTEEPHSESLALEREGRKLIVRPDRATLKSMWTFHALGALDPMSGYDRARDPSESNDLIPGPREAEFNRLLADASAEVAERFVGDLVVRIPAGEVPTELAVGMTSGVRGWRVFSGGEPARQEIVQKENQITAKFPPSRGPGWLVIEPRRRRDAFSAVVTGPQPVLGGGARVPGGESRWNWASLVGEGTPADGSAVLLSTSSASAPAGTERGAEPISSESIARLRSLGYVNFAQDSTPVARPSLLPGEGNGQFRIRWLPGER